MADPANWRIHDCHKGFPAPVRGCTARLGPGLWFSPMPIPQGSCTLCIETNGIQKTGMADKVLAHRGGDVTENGRGVETLAIPGHGTADRQHVKT